MTATATLAALAARLPTVMIDGDRYVVWGAETHALGYRASLPTDERVSRRELVGAYFEVLDPRDGRDDELSVTAEAVKAAHARGVALAVDEEGSAVVVEDGDLLSADRL